MLDQRIIHRPRRQIRNSDGEPVPAMPRDQFFYAGRLSKSSLLLNYFSDNKYMFVRGSAEFWLGRELAHDYACAPKGGLNLPLRECLLSPTYYSGLFAHKQTPNWPGHEPALRQMARSARCPSPLGGFSTVRARK